MRTTTPLFKEIHPLFFRPLAGRLAPLYWAILENLYVLDFEGEPFEITFDVAVEQSALLLEQNPDFTRKPEELEKEIDAEWGDGSTQEPQGELEERPARRIARQVLKRLQQCGWFDTEYREARRGYVLNFRDYAARVLHTLRQVSTQEQTVFEGLAYAIRSALAQDQLEEKPGVALYNAQKATKDLVREIKILSRNIHRYAERALKEAKTPKDLLDLQLEVYQSKVVDSSYHRFKTTDNVFRYRAFILQMLNFLEEQAELQASAVQWIARNEAISYGEAHERMSEWVSLIRSQMLGIHQLTDDLDRKNARYTATTLQQISYLLNHDRDLQGKLVKQIKRLAEMRDAADGDWPATLPMFRVRWVAPDSLYVAPERHAPVESKEVEVPEVSQDQRKAALERARKTLDGQYSKARVQALALRLLEEKDPLKVEDLPMNAPEDLTRAVFLVAHGRDKKAPYRWRADSDWKERNVKRGRALLRPGRFEGVQK